MNFLLLKRPRNRADEDTGKRRSCSDLAGVKAGGKVKSTTWNDKSTSKNVKSTTWNDKTTS